MPSHSIICESCDAEYSVYIDEPEVSLPLHCAFCGSDLPEDNITTSEDLDEWSDDDWDKLTDETLDDDEWKWDDKN
jgi:hypothetical protein